MDFELQGFEEVGSAKKFDSDVLHSSSSMSSLLCSTKNRESIGVLSAYVTFLLSVIVVIRQFSDGDFSAVLTLGAGVQCLGFTILAMKIRDQKSVAGMSGRTLQMYVLVLVIRLTSTLKKNGYIPIDKSGDWVYQAADIVTLSIVLHLLYRVFVSHKATYDEANDSFPIWPCVPPCLLLAALIHADLNNSFFYDTVWTASANLDTIALLPQLWMLAKKGGEVDALTSHFVAALVVSRFCAFSFWFYGYPELAPRKGGFNAGGWWVIGVHTLQLVISADFMYHYMRSGLKKEKMVLPVLEV